MQESFIFILFSKLRLKIAFFKSEILASLSINIHVFRSIIDSFNQPSSTQITGTQQAIDSIGLIPKSSFTGI
jgi:hypothetical protein